MSSLYNFTTFTFTPNGATGRSGPSALTYNTTTYPWIPSYLTLSAGIQRWVVPATGSYILSAAGAAGGSSSNYAGGKGVIVKTTVSLTQGDNIYILVGQAGVNSVQGSGGGGTFIVKYLGGSISSAASYTVLLVAGGGGSAALNNGGGNAVTTTAGGVDPPYNSQSSYCVAATGGNGGNTWNGVPGIGGGGGGWLTNGAQGHTNTAAQSFLNGGLGGTYVIDGGFGGGGGSDNNENWGVSGGGGYSGGSAGGANTPTWVWTDTGAGGGGSYDINGTSNNATLDTTQGVSGYNTSTGFADVMYNSVPSNVVCFKEGSKILTDKGYKPIQDLRKGDLVQTFVHGYKAIDMIGKRDMIHIGSDQRIKDQLYVCTPTNYPELLEDLVITGCHSILVDDFKEGEEQRTREINGDTYITDNMWRLPACADLRAAVYDKKGVHTIYHIALENDDYYMNYGVYSNGLLVETCSKRYLKELSNMELF